MQVAKPAVGTRILQEPGDNPMRLSGPHSLRIQWGPVGSVGIRGDPWGSVGIRWDPLGSVGIRWDPFGSVGIRWDPLGSVGIRGDPLGSVGIRWDPLPHSQWIQSDPAGSVGIQWDPYPRGSRIGPVNLETAWIQTFHREMKGTIGIPSAPWIRMHQRKTALRRK